VQVRFAMPGSPVDFPLEVQGDPARVEYKWERVGAGILEDGTSRAFGTLRLVAPATPGFYRLVLTGGGTTRRVDGLTLGVLVPFAKKQGATLNGYRIGLYRGERAGEFAGPEGFVEIGPEVLDLPISTHLKLGDFITHDDQVMWPRYAALDVRLLDKIELVIAEVAQWKRSAAKVTPFVGVHSGFRTPLHNRRVTRAARDSRHQYGDAADIALDANGDGRISAADLKLAALAVEVVEREHPDLVGGLGLYSLGAQSYIHVDVRGERVRWRG
jgi:hypothetical protein